MKSKRGKILSVVLVIIMVLSMLPISAIAKDVEKDNIEGWGYWSENSYLMHMKQASPVEYNLRFPGLDSTNYWLQLVGDDKSYIAFCFNEKKGAPKRSKYLKKYDNADIKEFEALAETPMKDINFRNAVIWATHLGFPENQGSFKGQSILDRAVDFYHIPEDCAVDAVHLATQMAIWLFTDYDTALKTFFSPINADNSLGNGDPSRVKIWDRYDKSTMGDPITYLAADIAAASRDKHHETPKDVELDLYKPYNTHKQNLLVTHHTEMKIDAKPAKVTLNIQKKMSDGRPVKDQEFSFKFTGNNGQQDFDLPIKNDAQGKVNIPEIEFKKPGKYQFFIEEIPGSDPMVEYQKGKIPITVNVEGVRELKAEVSYGDKNPSQLVITNQAIAPKLGQLQIIKDVTGEDADPDKLFDFTVTLTGPDGKLLDGEFGGHKFKNGTTNIKVSKNVPVTIKEIPVGTTYVVSEAPLTQDDDYTLTSQNNLTGKIDENNTAKAAFLNTAKPKPLYGDLMISKEVKSAPADHSQDRFDFTVKLEDPNADTTNVSGAAFTNGVAKFSLAAGETCLIKGLPAGMGYTVTEDNAKDYAMVSTGSTGRIVAKQQRDAKFVNTYLKTGELTIQKVIDGASASDQDVFTFRVTLTQGNQMYPNGTCKVTNQNGDVQTVDIIDGVLDVTITGSGFVTITDLHGDVNYHVEEKTADGTFTATESNPVEHGYILTDVMGNDLATATDGKMKVTFTNTRDAATGYLQIFKMIEGSNSSTEDEFGFRITLKTPNGNPLSGGFTNQDGDKIAFDSHGVAVVPIRGGNSGMPRFVQIKDIPAGTRYTVEEYTGTLDEYTVVPGTLVKDGYILKSVDGADSGSISEGKNAVTFVNRKADTSLTIEKTIAGNIWTDDIFTFDVQLSGDGAGFSGDRNGISFANGHATVTIRGAGSVTIKDLPECDYTVTEQPIDGWIISGEQTGALADRDFATAKFVNTKPLELSFRARKTLDGQIPKEGLFSFILKDEGGAVLDVQKNDAYGMILFAPQSIDHEGVYTYTIEEESGTQSMIAYDKTVYTALVDVTKNDQTGVLEAKVTYQKNGNAPVTDLIFENRTIPMAGVSVTVKKVWKIDNGGVPTDSVTAVLLKDGEKFAAVELNAQNGWSFTWDDLDPNSVWTVDETNVPAGFRHEVTGENGVFTITNDDIPTEPSVPETTAPTVPETTDPGASETTTGPSAPHYSGHTPHAGDGSNMLFWIMMTMASVTCVAVILLSKKGERCVK